MNKLTKLLLIILCLPMFANAQFISSDDKLHIAAGALISSGTYTLVYTKTKDKKKAFWYSLGTAALAGLAKEVYDSTKKGNRFDTGEAIATTSGGFVASITFHIFYQTQEKANLARLEKFFSRFINTFVTTI